MDGTRYQEMINKIGLKVEYFQLTKLALKQTHPLYHSNLSYGLAALDQRFYRYTLL